MPRSHNLVLRQPGKLVPLRDSRFESGSWRLVYSNNADNTDSIYGLT